MIHERPAPTKQCLSGRLEIRPRRGTGQDRQHLHRPGDAPAAQGRTGHGKDDAGPRHCREPRHAADRPQRQVEHEARRGPVPVRHAHTPQRQPLRRLEARREQHRSLHPDGQDRPVFRRRRKDRAAHRRDRQGRHRLSGRHARCAGPDVIRHHRDRQDHEGQDTGPSSSSPPTPRRTSPTPFWGAAISTTSPSRSRR